MKRIIVLLFLLTVGMTYGQNKNAKATIEVDGVCMMCKLRIEKNAVRAVGVKSAVWNMETHQLSLIYNEKKTNLDAIQKVMADAGHDTKAYKASDEAYGAIDDCCKYRDPKVVDDHKGMNAKHKDGH